MPKPLTERQRDLLKTLSDIYTQADRTGNREYVQKIEALVDHAGEEIRAGRHPPTEAQMKEHARLGCDWMGRYRDRRTLQ